MQMVKCQGYFFMVVQDLEMSKSRIHDRQRPLWPARPLQLTVVFIMLNH